jgi:N-formylmaleamate deformylase
VRSLPAGARDELRTLGAQSRLVGDGPRELHVLDYGGDGVPLLVLPGITSPAITWDFVVAGLRDLVRPLVLDLRGRGLSATGRSYTIEDFAGDAETVVQDLALERPILLGHSLGARIAAAVAARREVAIAGSVVVDPPLSGPDRGAYPTPRQAFVDQLREAQAGTTADDVGRYYPRWPRSELLLRARWLPSCDEAAVLATYDEFEREDFFDWWPRVDAPVAFMHGEDSPVVTAAGARDAAEANRTAAVRAVPHAGHMVPWDNFTGFMTETRSLLTTLFDIVPAAAAGQ